MDFFDNPVLVSMQEGEAMDIDKYKTIAQRKREVDRLGDAGKKFDDYKSEQVAKDIARQHSLRRRKSVKDPRSIPLPASPPKLRSEPISHNFLTPSRGRTRGRSITPKWTPNSRSRSRDRKMPARRSTSKKPVKRAVSRSRSRSSTPYGAPNINVMTGSHRMSKSMRENIKGILYPHALTKPRHLDGAVHESQTTFERTIASFTVPTGNEGIILMAPNCTCPIQVSSDAQAPTPTVLSYNPDLTEIGLNSIGLPLSTAAGIITKTAPVEKWRVVSQGMRLQFLNTSETNDGYFMAFRISTNYDIGEVSLVRRSGAASQTYMAANSAYITKLFDSTNESHFRGSLVIDSLKNLSQHYFRLNPYAEEHPFKDIANSYQISGTNAYISNTWTPSTSETTSWKPVLNDVYDNTFDAICVVVRPGLNPANILIDAVQNVEVVYSNESSLARFHERAQGNDVAQGAIHRLQNTNSRATLPIATS